MLFFSLLFESLHNVPRLYYQFCSLLKFLHNPVCFPYNQCIFLHPPSFPMKSPTLFLFCSHLIQTAYIRTCLKSLFGRGLKRPEFGAQVEHNTVIHRRARTCLYTTLECRIRLQLCLQHRKESYHNLQYSVGYKNFFLIECYFLVMHIHVLYMVFVLTCRSLLPVDQQTSLGHSFLVFL